jgi:hypothetical protein
MPCFLLLLICGAEKESVLFSKGSLSTSYNFSFGQVTHLDITNKETSVMEGREKRFITRHWHATGRDKKHSAKSLGTDTSRRFT